MEVLKQTVVLWEEGSQMFDVGFMWYLREKTEIFV